MDLIFISTSHFFDKKTTLSGWLNVIIFLFPLRREVNIIVKHKRSNRINNTYSNINHSSSYISRQTKEKREVIRKAGVATPAFPCSHNC